MDCWFGGQKGRAPPRSAVEGDLYMKAKGVPEFSTFSAYSKTYVKENENCLPTSRFSRKSDKVTGDEILKKEDMKQESPSVIAKLMGLDAQTTREPVSKCGSNLGSLEPRCSTSTHHNLRVDDKYSQLCGADKKEYKVDSIASESSILDRKNLLLFNFLHKKRRTAMDNTFVNERLDMTCPSINENRKGFMEYCSEREVCDSKSRILQTFDEKTSSECTNHFHVSSKLPKHIENRIKSLISEKSRGGQTHHMSDRETVVRNAREHTHRGKSLHHSMRNVAGSLSTNFTKTKVEEEQGTCPLPTHIVVLKPSLDKAERESDVSSLGSLGISQISYRKLGYPRTENCRLVVEVHKFQKMPYGLVPVQKKVRNTSELWLGNEENSEGIATGNSTDLSSSGESKSPQTSGQIELPQTKIFPRETMKLNVLDTLSCSSGQLHDMERCNRSLDASMESSVSREARRHLSKQWTISQNAKKAGNIIKSPCTLAEMLALSDRENLYKKYMEAHGKDACSLRMRRKDDQNNVCPIVVSVSPSHPSSTSYTQTGNLMKPSSRDRPNAGHRQCTMLKDILNLSPSGWPPHVAYSQTSSYPYHKAGSRNDVFLKDALCSSKSRNDISATKSQPSFSKSSQPNPSSTESGTANSVTDDTESALNYNADMFIPDAVLAQPSGNANDLSKENKVSVVADFSPMHGQSRSPCDLNILESRFLTGRADDEQSSPNSVLDPLDENGGPGCFQKVNADLHELRLQLDLLKSESVCGSSSSSSEDLEAPNEEAGNSDGDSVEIDALLEFPTDEEERDFSYILGILTDSGFKGIRMDKVFGACYLPETPIDPSIFEKLEKVFDEPEVWSRDERKLLFDLTNTVLSKFLAPCIDLHPWVWSGKILDHIPGRKLIAGDIWSLLVRKRTELSSKPREPFIDENFLDNRSNIDSIGRHVEEMIRDDLLEELISDLICRY